MTESIGTYYADIRPDARGFVDQMRGPILADVDRFGREAGKRFSSSFNDEVSSHIGDAFTRSRPDTDRRSRSSGEAAGDAFGRALRGRVETAIRSLPDIKVDADTSEIDRKMARIRADMVNIGTRMRLGLSDDAALAELHDLQLQLGRLTGPGHDIRVRTNAAAAAAELAALQTQLRGVDRTANAARKPVGLLWTAILSLGPALIPLGGAALGAGAGLVAGMGVAALAVLGARKQMTAGTEDGLKFAGGIGELKGVLGELEATASHGILDGFQSSVDSLTASLPSLDANVASISTRVGSIGAHTLGGLTGGLETFGPLIDHVLDAADRLAGRFEKWASGPGGSKFAQTLIRDFDDVGPLIHNVADDAVKLIQAFAPSGGASLSLLTMFTGLVGDIPVGVMKAATTAYVAFKIAVAASSGITAASAALRGFAAAETEAAVASTRLAGAQGAAGAAGGIRGLAGGMATIIGRAAPYAAAWLGIAYATKAGTSALGDYEHQMSSSKAIAGSTLKTLSDVFSFHWSSIGHDLGGYERQEGFASAIRQMQADIGSTIGGAKELDTVLDGASSSAIGDYFKNRPQVGQGLGPLLPSATWDNQTRDTINQYHRSASAIAAAAAQADKTVAAAQKEYDLIRANVAKGDYTAGSQSAAAKDNLDAAKASADRLHNAYLALIELQEKAREDTKTISQFRQSYLENNQGPKVAANDYILNTSSSYSQAATGLAAYQKQLVAARDSEAQFNDVTIKNGEETNTSKEALAAWNAALDQTGGNIPAATALVLAHQDAYKQDARDIAQTTLEQNRINSAVAAAATAYGAQSAKYATSSNQTARAVQLTSSQVELYGSVLGVTARDLADGSVSQDAFVRGVLRVAQVAADAGTSTSAYLAAVEQFSSGLDTAASRAQLLGSAMVALNGDAISYANAGAAAASANQSLVDDFAKLGKGVLNLKTGMLDYHNAGAQPVLADLAQLQTAAQTFASATYQDEVATKGRTQAAKDAASVYYNDTHGALIAEADQLGLTHTQAKALADQYFHWPKNARTQIEQLGGDDVKSMLSAILEDLDAFTGGHHADLYVDATLSPSAKALGLANVGKLISSGHTVNGVSAQANGGILDFYADGGIRENHVAQIAPAGAMRVWAEKETGGEAYLPLAPSKRARTRVVADEAVSRLGGMVHWFESGGFHGVKKPPPDKAAGSSSSSASAAASQQAADLSAEKNAIDALRQALFGATAQLITATGQLYWGAKRAGATDQILSTLANERTRLIEDSRLLTTTNAEIGKTRTYLAGLQQQASQYRSAVTTAGLGQFDITSAGVRTSTYTDRPAGPVSISSITADAKAAADREALEKSQLAKLHAAGLNSTLYHQLATGDPAQEAAQLAALSKATPAEIRALNAQYGRLSSTTSSLAGTVVGQRYGGQISAAQGLLNGVDPKTNPALAKAVHDLGDTLFGAGKWAAQGISRGLLDEKAGLSATMRTLADEMVTQVKRALGIKSPSRVMHWHGQMTARGLVTGIQSEFPAIRDAAARMAAHAVPVDAQTFGGASGSSGTPAGWSGKLELHGGIVDMAEFIPAFEAYMHHRERVDALTGGI